jgi:hypothetical protein
MTPTSINEKALFLNNYRDVIIDWANKNEELLVDGRKRYSWGDDTPTKCTMKRAEIIERLYVSKERNSGGIDLKTVNDVLRWGGFPSFPLDDPKEVLELTRDSLRLLDSGDTYGATIKLLRIPYVGIATATKILGLTDPERFCIYDSRVGTALRTLQKDGRRLILCPPGRSRGGDSASDSQWARNYERLIWTLEVIRDQLNSKGYSYIISDIEMGLFMMGK